MKWFSIKGIREEASKVKWPKPSELSRDTLVAIAFMVVFALYFIFSDFVVAFILKLIKVGQ